MVNKDALVQFCKDTVKKCQPVYKLLVKFRMWIHAGGFFVRFKIKKFMPTEAELAAQRAEKFADPVLFSILVPLYNTPEKYLRAMLASVREQTYRNWELCLADGSDASHAEVGLICQTEAGRDSRIRYQRLEKNGGISENTNACLQMAKGDYIVLLDHDDRLSPNALYENAKAIADTDADFLYSDEVKFTEKQSRAFDPYFKTDFAIDNLRANNYICHLTVFRRDLTEKAGVFRTAFDGSQDYDLILRLCECAGRIVHIPKLLYFWRVHLGSTALRTGAKDYTVDAGVRAVQAHLDRLGIDGTVTLSETPTVHRLRYAVEGNPKISILIPNMDHKDDLKTCIDSILHRSTYRNVEIIVIENNSRDPETFAYYDTLRSEPRVRIEPLRIDGFNFSRINNFGASVATGDYLLMLNNDIEVIAPSWLEEMLMYAQRPDVGAVGAKLYYPDDTIQHAGVIVGMGDVAGHCFKRQPRTSTGYMHRAMIAGEFSAVTAACMMVRKTVFDEIGGLDEEFAVAFNDVDLCMQIRRAGYLIVMTPYAELYHHESVSRGYEDTPEKQERFSKEIRRFKTKWAAELEQGDPFYNKNLTLRRESVFP